MCVHRPPRGRITSILSILGEKINETSSNFPQLLISIVGTFATKRTISRTRSSLKVQTLLLRHDWQNGLQSDFSKDSSTQYRRGRGQWVKLISVDRFFLVDTSSPTPREYSAGEQTTRAGPDTSARNIGHVCFCSSFR